MVGSPKVTISLSCSQVNGSDAIVRSGPKDAAISSGDSCNCRHVRVEH